MKFNNTLGKFQLMGHEIVLWFDNSNSQWVAFDDILIRSILYFFFFIGQHGSCYSTPSIKCGFGLAFGRAKSNSRGIKLILDWF
jgi:hypothetical protein